ncbi:unnamed protein product [Amoebophrya sp. A25]|nr:unnamed protein product [Amoebophrya sp. A25]|eukprot:GSA25T00002335001.1
MTTTKTSFLCNIKMHSVHRQENDNVKDDRFQILSTDVYQSISQQPTLSHVHLNQRSFNQRQKRMTTTFSLTSTLFCFRLYDRSLRFLCGSLLMHSRNFDLSGYFHHPGFIQEVSL